MKGRRLLSLRATTLAVHSSRTATTSPPGNTAQPVPRASLRTAPCRTRLLRNTLCVLLVAIVLDETMSWAHGGVTFLPPDKARDRVSVSFALGFPVFYSNSLYAASSIGVVEVRNASFWGLHVWKGKPRDSESNGLWYDPANRRLWASRLLLTSSREIASQLWSYDGTRWREVKQPVPGYGYFTRFDALHGYRSACNGKTFWLLRASRAWAWGPAKGTWDEVLLPEVFRPPGYAGPMLKAIIPLEEQPYLVKRDPMEPIGALDLVPIPRWEGKHDLGDSIYGFAGGQWAVITNLAGKFYAFETAAVGGKGYIRTRSGDLLEVTGSGVRVLSTPGKCGAIASSPKGALLACFQDRGVFRLDSDWRLLLPCPYKVTDEQTWVYLATDGEQVAVAVKPPSYQAGRPEFEGGLWVSQHSQWREIVISSARKAQSENR